jgi:hypothetical protein
MIRVLLILVNVFFFWMARLLSGDPAADITAPESVKPGESFTVNVKVMVNDAKDFMRFTMVLPEGFTATAGQTDGAKFLFEEQKVKFIWAQLSEEEMNISFTVKVPATASGAYSFQTNITHPVDNLPSSVLLNPLKITVGESPAPVAVQPVKPDTTQRPPVQVSVLRTVPNAAVTGEFFVDMSIQKGDLRTFLKLVDSIPPGCSAVLVNGDGSSDFECKDGAVTIRWYSLTERPSLNIRYKVIASPDMEGTYPIKGMISYVENETGKLIPIPPSEVTFKPSAALAGNNQRETNSNNDEPGKPAFQSNANAVEDAQKPQEGGIKTTAVVTSGNNQKAPEQQPVQPTSTSAVGVNYSVQIAAMQRNVPVSYYAGTYAISTPINREQVDGLNKYTTGNYSSYDAARNGREQLRGKGVEGPFVTAYSNGRRITVQEALMITSQKWVR